MATSKVPVFPFPAQTQPQPQTLTELLVITAEQISKYAEISSLASGLKAHQEISGEAESIVRSGHCFEEACGWGRMATMNNQTASFAEILRSYREATGDRRPTLDLPPTVLSRLLLQAHKLSRCATVRRNLFKRMSTYLATLVESCFFPSRNVDRSLSPCCA